MIVFNVHLWEQISMPMTCLPLMSGSEPLLGDTIGHIREVVAVTGSAVSQQEVTDSTVSLSLWLDLYHSRDRSAISLEECVILVSR